MSGSKLLLCLGPGGVGKTTTSAAIACALAKRGHKCVVMTVDPARRLAQALGMKELSNHPQKVTGIEGSGSLDALWLQNQNALEELASKHISDEEQRKKLFSHRFFRVIESQLGGIEEYLGVEKALQLVNSGDYDYCILDTPPSKHAIDFIESPKHLLRFFDDSILKYFLQDPEEKKRGLLGRIFNFGKEQALDLFRRVLGRGFFRELASLLQLLGPLHKVLRDTAVRAEALFSNKDQSSFVLIATPEEAPTKGLFELKHELEFRGLLKEPYTILNRCLPDKKSANLEELSQVVGAPRAQLLLDQAENFSHWQQQIQEALATGKLARLEREGFVDFDLEKLAQMGEDILNQWHWKKA